MIYCLCQQVSPIIAKGILSVISIEPKFVLYLTLINALHISGFVSFDNTVTLVPAIRVTKISTPLSSVAATVTSNCRIAVLMDGDVGRGGCCVGEAIGIGVFVAIVARVGEEVLVVNNV